MIPIFLGEIKNMGPLNIGLIVSTMGIAWMLSGPFVGKLLEITGARIIVGIGCVLIGIGTFYQTTITADYTLKEFYFSQVLKGIGAQFLWIGNQYLSLANFSNNAIYNAAAVFNLVLRLAAAVSISFTSTLLVRWKTQYLWFLFENKNPSITEFQNMNNNSEITTTHIEYINKKDYLFTLYSERESLIMAINKISFISMWAVLIPIFLMLYIKTSKKNILY